jgi:isoleucyl-tRNA synthetase
VTYFYAAEQFAREAIANQKEAFRSWGVMADWDKCYFTFDKDYVKNLLQQFYTLYEMVCGTLYLIIFSFTQDLICLLYL